jgi:DNA-binding transcriptional LysR family regulator
MVSTRHDVFLMVALHNSFSKASHALYISQPAISRHIKTLEEYYHTRLFNRTGAHISLTAAGEILLERLTQVKAIQEQTENDIAGISARS